MAEARVVKFYIQVGSIKTYQTDDTISHITPKRAWLWLRDPFKFLVPLKYLW